MKLVYFLPLLSTKGGQERTLTDKANWLVNKGHDVMMVTYENDGPLAYPLNQRVQHIDLACPYFQIYHLPFFRRFLVALKIKNTFRKRMAKVVSAFSPDVIVVTVPLSEFFLTDLMQVVGKVPVVIESHLAHGFDPLARGKTERILDIFYPPMKAVCRSKLLIALTEGDARTWRKYHHNVCVIPNPLTCYPQLSTLNPQFSTLNPPPPRIICVGRLSPQKRFDRMIDAFALIADKYPDWRVDIFGAGGTDGQLYMQQCIAGKELNDRIGLHPPVNDIYAEYLRSQFFVMSSDFEGFGLVIIEAMACGIPVVSTDCPYGPSEIITNGKTGLLAKMDVQDLADKMEWMIIHDAERQQMGIRAYQAAAHYSLERVMPEWEQAYFQK